MSCAGVSCLCDVVAIPAEKRAFSLLASPGLNSFRSRQRGEDTPACTRLANITPLPAYRVRTLAAAPGAPRSWRRASPSPSPCLPWPPDCLPPLRATRSCARRACRRSGPPNEMHALGTHLATRPVHQGHLAAPRPAHATPRRRGERVLPIRWKIGSRSRLQAGAAPQFFWKGGAVQSDYVVADKCQA